MAFWLGQYPILAAPPPNDQFAQASLAPAALPAEVTGSNVDATEEPGELIPSAGLRTVWWVWTPAATGWVRVRTLTPTDTVLAAYSGTSLSNLVRIAYNDDDDLDDIGPSALKLLAQAGVPVRLQVSGYDGETGPISLRIETTEAPPTVSAFTLTPSSANVTAAESTVTVQATLVSGLPAPPVQDAWITLARPADEDITFRQGLMPRITGTSANGTYRGTLVLPRYLPPEPNGARLSAQDRRGWN